MTIKKELERIRKQLSVRLRPISKQGVRVSAEYLGISESDMDKEVTTREFLALYHNAILHQAYLDGSTRDNWQERCHPVAGIPQSWDDE